MVNGSLMGRTALHLKIEEFLVPFFTSTIQWKLLIPIIKECIKGKYERKDKKNKEFKTVTWRTSNYCDVRSMDQGIVFFLFIS